MNFTKALEILKNGGVVTRKGWHENSMSDFSCLSESLLARFYVVIPFALIRGKLFVALVTTPDSFRLGGKNFFDFSNKEDVEAIDWIDCTDLFGEVFSREINEYKKIKNCFEIKNLLKE